MNIKRSDGEVTGDPSQNFKYESIDKYLNFNHWPFKKPSPKRGRSCAMVGFFVEYNEWNSVSCNLGKDEFKY